MVYTTPPKKTKAALNESEARKVLSEAKHEFTWSDSYDESESEDAAEKTSPFKKGAEALMDAVEAMPDVSFLGHDVPSQNSYMVDWQIVHSM